MLSQSLSKSLQSLNKSIYPHYNSQMRRTLLFLWAGYLSRAQLKPHLLGVLSTRFYLQPRHQEIHRGVKNAETGERS